MVAKTSCCASVCAQGTRGYSVSAFFFSHRPINAIQLWCWTQCGRGLSEHIRCFAHSEEKALRRHRKRERPLPLRKNTHLTTIMSLKPLSDLWPLTLDPERSALSVLLGEATCSDHTPVSNHRCRSIRIYPYTLTHRRTCYRLTGTRRGQTCFNSYHHRLARFVPVDLPQPPFLQHNLILYIHGQHIT